MMDERSGDQFLVALIVSALLKAALLRWLALGSDDVLRSLALEAAAIVVFICVIDAIPGKRKPMLDFAGHVVIVAIMYANLLYTSYFDQIVDPSTLMVAEQVGAVRDIVAGLLRPVHIFFVADLPLLFVWAHALSERTVPRTPRRGMVAVSAIAAALVLGFQVVTVHGMVTSVDSLALARARGVGAYQVASFLDYGDSASAAPQEAAQAAQGGQSGDLTTPGGIMQKRIAKLRGADNGVRVGGVMRGAYAGANVIVIQVESYQALAYGTKIGGQEITPNMNRLADDCWVCTNAFSQTGAGNTADAEFIVNSSLLPPVNRAASVAYTNKKIPALPRVLSEAGYRTVTMHANDASFWNRRELYPALGFDDYYDADQFGTYDKMYKGASDEVFFSRAEEYISNELEWDKPLYTMLVTMSSHAPYEGVPEDRRPLYVPAEWSGHRAANWLGAISYTDATVGDFVGWLRQSGLWDSSIIVLYGDHVALKDLKMDDVDTQIVEGLLGRKYSEVDRQRVPLMIHLPGQVEGGTISSTVGQADIAPTIADLLGVSLDNVPHVGRSVFVDSSPLVITRSYFPVGSFLNGNVAFMPQLSFDDGTALDVVDGREVTPTALERRDFARVKKLNALSEEWVRSLPARPDAGDPRDAYIPVKSQRSESE